MQTGAMEPFRLQQRTSPTQTSSCFFSVRCSRSSESFDWGW